LKCDIKKFFASVDHQILLNILGEYISDGRIILLLKNVIDSFSSEKPGIGISLGNLTSQLFANIYLNKLDQFIKHKLGTKYYLRYADDFVILSENKKWLRMQIRMIQEFLWNDLKFELHNNKVFIRKFNQGIDFLGYVVLPHYRVLRTRTKRRIFRKIRQKRLDFENGKISEESFNQSLQSYLGILKHCYGHKVKKRIIEIKT